MKKVEIFDPAMCCSTGVCGPTVDPELTRIASAVYSLEKKGFAISRHNLTDDPGAFVDNKLVNQVLVEKGPDALPVVLVNGELVKIAEYPTTEELAEWFETVPSELQEKPRVRVSLNINN